MSQFAFINYHFKKLFGGKAKELRLKRKTFVHFEGFSLHPFDVASILMKKSYYDKSRWGFDKMKYRIDEKENGIEVKVEVVKEKKEKLLNAFKESQEGRCSCPTEEYKKLESLEIEHGEGSIKLSLNCKEGTKIDKNEISRCLEYTSARVESEDCS